MNTIEFVRKIIIEDIGKLQTSGFHYISFSVMAQAIETLGAFIDNKPFRAQKQSKNRFSSSLYHLFDKKYSDLNQNGWLHDKLRNHMAHTLIPSSYLILAKASDPNYGTRHLKFEEEKLVLVAEDLYNDLKKASEKLIQLLERGKIPQKKIGEIRSLSN